MWPNHRLVDLLGIEHPLVLAPMAGLGTVELAAAVCAGGGLGSLGCVGLQPELVMQAVAKLRRLTDKPINTNFFCHSAARADGARDANWRDRLAPYYNELGLDPSLAAGQSEILPFDDALCTVVEQVKPEIVSFHFGLPDPALLARIKAAGCRVMASATTVAEARWLEAHGADVIIAQGCEAGGHRGMFLAVNLEAEAASQRARWRWCHRSPMPSVCQLSPRAESPTDVGSRLPSRSARRGSKSGLLTFSVLRRRSRRSIVTRCGRRVRTRR
jgi:nitronate monooxygenase